MREKKNKLNPIVFPLGVVVLCLIRWSCVANGFDYGWDFETGYRVYSGGVYGKDFYTAVGPLSYELIGLLFKIFGPRWIGVYCIYYGCWLFSMLGAYFILRTVSQRPQNLALALMLVAPLSIPHLTALHVYNCLSYALAVWSGVFCFQFICGEKIYSLILAAVLCSLCVFTKQNIGLGVAVMIPALVMLSSLSVSFRPSKKSILGSIVFFSVFASCSSFFLFYFSRKIGLSELWQIMFVDAAQAKGNLLNMLKAALPRLSFGFRLQKDRIWLFQHLAELFSYIFIVGFNFVFYRKFFNSTKTKPKTDDGSIDNRDLMKLFLVFCFSISLPLLFPNFVFKYREKFFWLDAKTEAGIKFLIFGFWYVLLNCFCYLAVLYKMRKEFWVGYKTHVLLLIFSIGMSVLACSSKFLYFFLNIPLLLGFFGVATLNIKLWSKRQILFLYAGLVAGVYLYYPTHALGPLERIEHPFTEGLLFSKTDEGFVTFYTSLMRPWVSNKRTLWLMHGGPHSLSGSIPVRNVSNLYFDQYNTRIEESLVRDWVSHPPELIIKDWIALSESSKWLNSDFFEKWIQDNYTQVAELNGRRVLKLKTIN